MKFFIAILFLVSSAICFAQIERPKNLPKYDAKLLHFGFTLGINTMDFTIKHSDMFNSLDSLDLIECRRQPGFNISVVTSLRLGEYWDLRFLPGLSFGQRNMEYSYWDARARIYQTHVMKIESTFLDFPLILKYKSKRINNFRPYVIFGNNFVYDLASQKEVKEEEKPKIRLRPFDVYAQVGMGCDFYLQFFKFSTEIKYGVGLLDIIKPDGTRYTTSIDRMNSKMVMLLFHFE